MDYLIVTPNGPPQICGIGDHSKGLRLLLGPQAEIWAKRTTVETPSDIRRGVPQLFQWLRARGQRTLIFQYAPFGYQNIPIQPFGLFAVALARMMRARVILVWHEPPERCENPVACARWLMERAMLLLGHVVIYSDPAWHQRLRGGRRTELIQAPIPSNFENVPKPPNARGERMLLLFGKNTLGKGIEPDLLRDVLSRVRETVNDVQVLAVGQGWEGLAPLGVEVIGPLDEASVRRVLAGADVALFPTVEPVGPKSGSVAAMLEAGVPVVATMFSPPSRQMPGVMFASTAEEMAEHIVRLLNDPEAAAALANEGHAYYSEHLSWQRVAQSLQQAIGHVA